MRRNLGSPLITLRYLYKAQVLLHKVVGVEKGGVVGIEEGGVNVAVEQGAVQVNHFGKGLYTFSNLLSVRLILAMPL